MKLPVIAFLLAICAACTTTTTSDNSDSTEFALDSTDLVNASVLIDTTYTDILPPSTFTKPQLDAKVAYVFNPGGLDVYETAGGENVVGNVEWRSRVALVLPLVNNVPSDTMTVDGLKGHFAEIAYNGKPGYVFSGYLVGMPVPENEATIVEYFSKNLHLVKPATRTTHECDCDAMSSEANYEFESGIVAKESAGYESYNNTVSFNNKMTLQEVYLIAGYFYRRLGELVTEFPQSESSEEKEAQVLLEVGVREGRITSIVISGGEGCTEEEALYEGDNGIVMSSNGGC